MMIIWIKKHPIISFMIGMLIVKLIIVCKLPIWAYGGAVHDDRLMVDNAVSLLKLNWLGTYNDRTLAKGGVFPLFLAILNFLSISYTTAVSLMYGLGCIIFIFVIKNIITNDKILMFIYTILLFCPASYCLAAFQKIYRNSISPAQIILVIAFFTGMYIKRNSSIKRYVLWVLGATMAFVSMWHTREDGIWVLPFVGAVISIIVIDFFYNYKKGRDKNILKKMVITTLPIVMLLCSIFVISSINYHYYGIFTENELLNSNFTKAYKSILSIEPEEHIDYVSIPHSTVLKLYEVSPTFKKVQWFMDNNAFETFGHYGKDGNIEDGWFFWALRNGVFETVEQKNAVCVNQFYLKMYNEIEAAFDNGTFKQRRIFSSPLMSPWSNRYFTPLIKTFGESVKFLVNYDTISTVADESQGDKRSIRLFETITGNQAIQPTESNLILNGWAFASNEEDKLEILLLNRNRQIIRNIDVTNSEDVFKYFVETTGNKHNSAKKARFSISQNVSDDSHLYFRVVINGQMKEEFELNGNIMNGGNKEYHYNFDNLRYDKVQDINASYMQKKIIIPNILIKLYKTTGLAAAVIGILCYIFIGMKCVTSIRSRKYKFVSETLMTSGMLGSLIILLGGVSYTNVSAYDAINATYLAAAYPLMIMFWTVSVGIVVQYVLDTKKIKF